MDAGFRVGQVVMKVKQPPMPYIYGTHSVGVQWKPLVLMPLRVACG